MKHTVRIAIFSALLCLISRAAPFMAVGDNAELFVTAAVLMQADDNIYLDNTGEQSDTIFSFTPGLDLVFGKGSVTKGNVYYREEIRRYSDNDNQDTSLSSLGVKTSYDNGVTKADFNAAYAQVAQNDNNVNPVGTIVHRQLTNLGARTEFGISEKTSLAIGVTFDRTDYSPIAYTDSTIWSIPVDLYYKSNPKLDYSAGFQYRTTDLSGPANDSNDSFFSLGARGEFTPKLVGQVRFGYTQRSFEVGGNQDLFGVDGKLTYAYSEKTSFQLNFGNDFGSSGFGDSSKIFTLGVNANSQFSPQWYLNTGLTYRSYEYPARTDDYVEGLIAVTYVYNAYVNFGASYTYRNNSSDLGAAEFTNNVFSLGANIRY